MWLAENPTFHSRTKLIEVHSHHVCQKIIEGHVKLFFKKTQVQVVGILTKALVKHFCYIIS